MDNLHIEGFELLEKLGAGGMGAVYKARQLSLDRLVAIKVLPRHYAQNADYIERFLIEAKIAASLKHNNIVQVYEAGKAGEDYYFVMELVSGYTVASWLERKGKLPEEDALLVVEYIADALRYTWDNAWIIHGDIKPANLMVDSDGTIKLADFLALTPPGGADRPASLKENVVGTPNYMSPEQARGVGKLDFRTDIYSLGAVLYHLVTGHLPFEEDEAPQDIMRRQLTDFVPDPATFTPQLSRECAWLIEKMMVKQGANRYHSWDDVILDMHRVKNGEMPLPPFPEKGCSTVQRTPVRERSVIRAPKNDTTRHAQDDISHKQASFSLLRTIIYILLILLFCGAGGYFARRHWLSQNQPAVSTLRESDTTVPLSPPPRTEVTHPVIPQPVTAPTPDPALMQQVLQAETATEYPDPQHAGDLIAYAHVFEKIIPLIHYRKNFTTADRLLTQWIQANPQNYFCERAMLDQERIQKMENVFNSIEQNQVALIGEPVRAKPRISGEFAGITNNVVTLTRSGSSGSQATLNVELYKLHETDLLKLIRKAVPEKADRSTIIWYIADAQYGKAASLIGQENNLADAEFLAQWNEDWGTMIINIRAYEALGKVKQEMSRHHYPEAKRLLESAQNRFALSDVFTWAYQEETERLNQQITMQMQQQRDQPPPATYSPPPEKHQQAEHDDFYEALNEPKAVEIAVNTDVDANDIDQYDILDVRENLLRLDGDVIRLRFTYRGDIRPVDPHSYTVDLGSEHGNIPAVFPSEGFKWIKRIPRWNGQKTRTVYAIVEGNNNRIRLLGRTKVRQVGNQPPSFSW